MTLNRRNFLFILGASVGAVAIDTLRPHGLLKTALAAETPPSSSGSFELPPLPYAYNALEPHIDAATMRFHHDRHHASYVKNLNAALEKHPELKGRTVEQLLFNLDRVPEDIRTSVRNNGGGHVNHTMFWRIMSPDGGGEPTGQIATVINQNFGSFAEFKKQFNSAGEGRFGSGWAWLIRTRDGNYQITSTANQDSPFMEGNYPIMGNDVWEHAYYLKYQNRRAEYLNAWWNVVNWNEINQRLAQVTKTT
ncbi:superoxide dismutase [Gloeocapsopsis dulcis]|uniref:Superoxide dismutase n=1 Tax=Gloeocapsopsis dulcis AAB1 = 1H9 TaxID=1433147 RepID=A0A6N8FX14_9CHRO|nr:superoxide dismutase [Gloeocapsopsis dulcis]MUL37481.1 superoxide dismutase [Gloeocapsopsis dulcis AAB1 = 1H9]WNN89503.1 superoxide dismutase [Gloeocapsopsis dulcis]